MSIEAFNQYIGNCAKTPPRTHTCTHNPTRTFLSDPLMRFFSHCLSLPLSRAGVRSSLFCLRFTSSHSDFLFLCFLLFMIIVVGPTVPKLLMQFAFGTSRKLDRLVERLVEGVDPQAVARLMSSMWNSAGHPKRIKLGFLAKSRTTTATDISLTLATYYAWQPCLWC